MTRGRLAFVLAVAAAPALAAAAGGRAVPGPAREEPVVEVRASTRGFTPSRVTVRRGEAVHLVLSSADGEHCFAIDALRVEKRVAPGRSTRLDLVPAQAGTFPFYCCLESGASLDVERGDLVVTE